jgi:hypothetical protein
MRANFIQCFIQKRDSGSWIIERPRTARALGPQQNDGTFDESADNLRIQEDGGALIYSSAGLLLCN